MVSETIHLAAGGAVFQRVLDQVLEQPQQFLAVAGNQDRRLRQIDLDLPPGVRCASGSSPSATWRMIGTRSTSVSGRTWADSSTRDSDNRSSISRAIRVAWVCMMPRKRSRALDVVFCRALQRVDEARQRRQRRAQFMAGIGDEIGAHFLDPAQRRLVVERHQHAFVGAAEQRRHRNRRDDQFHPAVDRHVIQIGGAARLSEVAIASRKCGDDLGRAQRELREFVLAQRRRKLGCRGIEVQDAAGAVEQHGGIRHAGDHGADGTRLRPGWWRGRRRAKPPRHATAMAPGRRRRCRRTRQRRGSSDRSPNTTSTARAPAPRPAG